MERLKIFIVESVGLNGIKQWKNNTHGSKVSKMSLEYMCQNCEVRLDPLMTKHEAHYFLKAGCPMCHQRSWVLVEGLIKEGRFEQ